MRWRDIFARIDRAKVEQREVALTLDDFVRGLDTDLLRPGVLFYVCALYAATSGVTLRISPQAP